MSRPQESSLLVRTGLMVSASVSALLIANPALAQTQAQLTPEEVEECSRLATAEQRQLCLAGQAEPTQPLQESGDIATIPPEEAAEMAAESGDGETIVVTGSRIRQPEFTSPDPIALIQPEVAQREGKIDTASMLQSSPIAAGSTQITSAISSNFVTAGGPGAQTLDLRGLGPNRTLVLLNGRRAGPAGVRGAVSAFDLNVLPQSIVGRVEILKTGASSIYGSDAIAGVVNLLTKTDMEGLQLDGNVSAPFESGGEQYRLSALWGKNFGRGHVMIAGDYFKQEELARGDRSYLACPNEYIFEADAQGNPTDQRADIIDPRTGEFRCNDLRWGHIWTYNLIDNLFLDNGVNTSINGGTVLLQYQYPGETLGIPTYGPPTDPFYDFGAPAGWFPTGYDRQSLAVQNAYHPFVEQQTIVPETKRHTLYADAAYELTDSIEAFGEFLYNRRETYQNGWRQFWNFGWTGDVGYDLYGTGENTGTIWGEGFTGFNLLSPTAITDQSDSSQKVDYYRGVGGLRGDFGTGFLNGWSWDAHVQYSRSNGRYRQQQILQDAYDTGYFQTESCVGTVTPISGKQCVDIPWADPFFLRGQLTQEQIDFLFDWEEGNTKYTQLSGEAIVTGSLFELPAGPLGVALGVHARRDRIRDVPGEITLVSDNPDYDPSLGILDPDYEPQFLGNVWGASTSGITAGRTTTTEAFGEVSLPVLRDRPFFRDLSFSAAARLTNVEAERDLDGLTSRDNGNWTYKLGGNWAVNEWLRFRGTYGTSFRAPALFELFLAEETSFPAQRAIDPCINWASGLATGATSQRVADNCAADGIPGNHSGAGVSATAIARGGIEQNVSSETSRAWTASVILTPSFSFLPSTRVSLAVDYFDFEITGQITQLGAGNILFGCYNSEFFPEDPLCDLFVRGQPGAPNNVDRIVDPFINIARQVTRGFDVTGHIRQSLGSSGSLDFLANATFQRRNTFALFEDTETSSLGEAGFPKFVGDFNVNWRSNTGGWSVFYGLDVYGKTSDDEDFIDANGTLCPTFVTYGQVCVSTKVPATFYHAASITKEINDRFEITLGMSNILDTRPPSRVTTLNLQELPPLLGPVVATSQYDFLGRRMFLNVTTRF